MTIQSPHYTHHLAIAPSPSISNVSTQGSNQNVHDFKHQMANLASNVHILSAGAPRITIPDCVNSVQANLATNPETTSNNGSRCLSPEEANRIFAGSTSLLLPVVTPPARNSNVLATNSLAQSSQFPTLPLTTNNSSDKISLMPAARSRKTEFTLSSSVSPSNTLILPTGVGSTTDALNVEDNTNAHNVTEIQNSPEAVTTPSIRERSVSEGPAPIRLNKFVRRLHDMLQSEKDSGIVEWRRGLLVLHSTDAFAKKILPKYFNTKNFKTFRRQLNYYGFVHVRSFSATGSTTTALWVNQDLAKRGTKSISSVLMLKRVEPCEAAKTAEGRRVRKEEAVNTVEDIGISARSIQLEQIRNLVIQSPGNDDKGEGPVSSGMVLPIVAAPPIPMIVHCPNKTESESSSNLSFCANSSSTMPILPNPWSSQSQLPSTSQLPQTDLVLPLGTTTPADETSTDAAANLLLMLSKSKHRYSQ